MYLLGIGDLTNLIRINSGEVPFNKSLGVSESRNKGKSECRRAQSEIAVKGLSGAVKG